MWERARELREEVVQGLAKVGLVWSLAVLAALFMVSAAHGEGWYAADAVSAVDPVGSAGTVAAPHTVGLALAVTVLIGGLAVLALGALSGTRTTRPAPPAPAPLRREEREAPAPADLPLALALGLTA